MNRQTWTALQQAGFVPGSALGIEVFFYASDEVRAQALAQTLISDRWDARISGSQPKGWRRKPSAWAVVAVRQIEDVQLPVLDALVDELESLASANDCVFDGWGAELPA